MCFLLYLYDYEVIRNSFFRVYADRKAHAEGGEDGGCESEGVDIAVDKRGNYAHGAQGGAEDGEPKRMGCMLFSQQYERRCGGSDRKQVRGVSDDEGYKRLEIITVQCALVLAGGA
mgnify:CR=1 FL=1